MKRLAKSKMVKRVVALAAAALMAFELIPFSSLTANAATLDIASGVTDAAKAAGFGKMDVTVKSDDATFDGAKATVTMSDGGEEYNKAIQALRDAGIAVDYRTTYMFGFSAESGDKVLDMSKAKADIDAGWGLLPTDGEFMQENVKYSVYVYDGKTVRQQTEGVTVEDYYGLPYYSGYQKFTVNGDEKVLYVTELKAHEALEPGVYSIDANLTVLGKNNAVLSGVQVYLTNTDLPPVEPLKQNGLLTVNNDGSMELSIENFSGIFTLQQIEDGTDVHVTGRTMDKTGLDTEPTTRINGLKIKLDNYNGFYSFTNAKQYPVILMGYTQMPVDLIVDFDSAELIYKPEAGKTEYTKLFTDEETGITATVRTTDETQGKKLDGATFKASKITGNEYDDMYYRMYRYRYADEYTFYNFTLTAADGSKLATGDNDNMLVNVGNIPVGEVSYPQVTIVGDELTDHSVSYADGKAVVNLNGLCKAVFYDKYYGYDIYHADSTATDGSGFKLTRYALSSSMVSSDGEARSEASGNEIKYYAKLATTSAMIGVSNKCDERFEISLPSENVKKHIYLVMTDGENTYVRDYKDIEKWYKDGRTYLNILDRSGKNAEGKYIDSDKNVTYRFTNKEVYGEEVYSSDFYGRVIKALNNGYNNVTPSEKTPVAYILNTDSAYAGMPILKSDYNWSTTYNGKEQPDHKWMLADNSSVNGTLNATNAGTYTFTVTPDDGYTWIDGTKDTKTYSWEMRKATLATSIDIAKKVVSSDEKIPEMSLRITQFVNGETQETASGFVMPTISGIPEKLEKGQVYTIQVEGGSADNYNISRGSVKLTVLKDGQICVKAPVKSTFIYNGKIQSVMNCITEDETSKQFYTSENTDVEVKNAYDSNYKNPLYFRLKDKENYIWDDGTTADKKFVCQVAKAELTVSYVSETIEEGQTPALEVKYDGFLEDDNIDNQKDFNTKIYVEAPEVLEGGKTYELTPKGSEYLNNYNITYKPGTLTVLKKQEEKPDENAKTVTANLIVPGELNKQLPGVTAYMTNPDNPLGIVPDGYDSVNSVAPTTPVSNNAKLTDNGDGTYNLTFNVPNPVFTLQKIGNCSNAEIISAVRDNKVYSGNTGVSRNGRITKLTIKLKDNSGTYVFNDCTEFPTLLETDWNVPLTLNVDFSGMASNDNVSVVSDVNKTTSDAPNVSVSGMTSGVKDYAKSLLTKEELEDVINSDGKLKLQINVGNIDNTVSDEDKQLVKAALENNTSLNNAVVGQYLDINAVIAGFDKKISELQNGESITLTVKLNDLMINKDADRTYYVVRIHENADGVKTAEVIDTTFDSVTGTIKFATDKFSTYAVVYTDKAAGNSDGNTSDDAQGSTDAPSTDSPSTGDTVPFALYVLTMISAGFAAILTLSKKRTENE